MRIDIKLPTTSNSKVIQLERIVDGETVLVMRFGDLNGKHSEILRQTLEELGITPTEESSRSRLITSRKQEGTYQLVGAGICMTYNKGYIFGSKSGAYGLGINKAHLEQCKPAFPQDATIRIDT